jgi:hypothetical protein
MERSSSKGVLPFGLSAGRGICGAWSISRWLARSHQRRDGCKGRAAAALRAAGSSRGCRGWVNILTIGHRRHVTRKRHAR